MVNGVTEQFVQPKLQLRYVTTHVWACHTTNLLVSLGYQLENALSCDRATVTSSFRLEQYGFDSIPCLHYQLISYTHIHTRARSLSPIFGSPFSCVVMSVSICEMPAGVVGPPVGMVMYAVVDLTEEQ